MVLIFVNGYGDETHLHYSAGESAYSVLLRNQIPPSAVLVHSGKRLISPFSPLLKQENYHARLLERYDIDSILDLYASSPGQESYVYQRLSLGEQELTDNRTLLSESEMRQFVEQRLSEVLTTFELNTVDKVLLAYSGGIDSTTLLYTLSQIADDLPLPEIHLVTIDDIWGREVHSVSVPDIARENLDLSHTTVEKRDIAEVYGLDCTLRSVFSSLENRSKLDAVSLGNSINRRMLEYYAHNNDITDIWYGDHSTDIIAGIIDSLISSTPLNTSSFPIQELGELRYIYPFSFHKKQDIGVYLQSVREVPITHEGFDPWELNPMKRHFCYYLADILQSFSPGLIYWLSDEADREPEKTATCSNCGKLKYCAELDDDLCEVCTTLANSNLIE